VFQSSPLALIDGLDSHRLYLNRVARTCERVLTARSRALSPARHLFQESQGCRNSPEIPRDNHSSITRRFLVICFSLSSFPARLIPDARCRYQRPRFVGCARAEASFASRGMPELVLLMEHSQRIRASDSFPRCTLLLHVVMR